MLVLYRTNGDDTAGKMRPEGFSKLECLRTYVASAEAFSGDLEFVTLADGPSDEARLDLAGTLGPVRRLPGLGNGKASRFAYRVGAENHGQETVLFLEDDYLLRPECFAALDHAAEVLEDVDYLTPYEHPDRYRRTDDWRLQRQRVWFDGQRHWRSVESTPSTFLARVDRLRHDLPVHLGACLTPTPQGRIRWRTLTQVPGVHRGWGRAVLASPMPSLAVHVELEQVSPLMSFEEFGFGRAAG